MSTYKQTILPSCFWLGWARRVGGMGIPSKARELEALCCALQGAGALFFECTPSARYWGGPDLIVGAASPVAIWVRRSDCAEPLSPAQHAEVDRVAAAGWITMISFGAKDALRDLQRRGVVGRMGGVYAFASTCKTA